MEKSNIEQKPVFKIETIQGPNGGEVSFCPERGGIITSLKLNGKEVLYLDEDTFKNIGMSVRGGIPWLFPNAGPLNKDSKFPLLQQHGFARNMKWETERIENGFCMTISSNEETRKLYPYDFQFIIEGKFEEDGSFTINQEVRNMEKDNELPISMGMHPYFNVSSNEKKNIKFNFEGGEDIEKQVDKWVNGKAVSIDNPKLKDPNAVLKVFIPNMGEIVIDASVEYQKIWIWSMPGKDFICVEPVMRDKNGLIDNPSLIKPQNAFKSSVNFKLE